MSKKNEKKDIGELTCEKLEEILKEATSTKEPWADANEVEKRKQNFEMPNSEKIREGVETLRKLKASREGRKNEIDNYKKYQGAMKQMKEVISSLLELEKPHNGGKIFKDCDDLVKRLLNSQGWSELYNDLPDPSLYLNTWKKAENPYGEMNLARAKKRFPEDEGFKVSLVWNEDVGGRSIHVTREDGKPVDLSYRADAYLTDEEEEEIFKKYERYNLGHSSGMSYGTSLKNLMSIWIDLVPQATHLLDEDETALNAFAKFLEGVVPYISTRKPNYDNIKRELKGIDNSKRKLKGILPETDLFGRSIRGNH